LEEIVEFGFAKAYPGFKAAIDARKITSGFVAARE